jgi:hypothetical protein
MPQVQNISFLFVGQQDIAGFSLLCSIGPIELFENVAQDLNLRDAQVRFKGTGLVLNSSKVF